MPLLTYASIGVGVLTAVLLSRFFFRDIADFVECLRFYFQPDLISLFRGEMFEDQWGTFKLFVWLAIAAGAGLAAHYKLPLWFPQLVG